MKSAMKVSMGQIYADLAATEKPHLNCLKWGLGLVWRSHARSFDSASARRMADLPQDDVAQDEPNCDGIT